MPDLMGFVSDSASSPVNVPPSDDISGAIKNFDIHQFATEPQKSSLGDNDITKFLQSALDAVEKLVNTATPEYKSPDTKKYMQTLQEVARVHTDTAATIDEQVKKYEAASQTEKYGLQSSATATVQRNIANQEQAQRLASTQDLINSLMGEKGNASRLADKIDLFHRANDRAIKLKNSVANDAADLREENDVNFLDDPVRWLKGIFTIPQLNHKVSAGIQQVNIVNDTLEGIEKDIKATSSANRDAMEFRSKALPSYTAQQAAADNALATAKAAEASAKADMDLASKNAGFAGLKFADAVAANSAEHQSAIFAQERAAAENRIKVMAIAQADTNATARLRIAELAQTIQSDEQITGMLRGAEGRLGVPSGTFTVPQYKRMKEEHRNWLVGQSAGFTALTPGEAYFAAKAAQKDHLGYGPNVSQQTAKAYTGMHDYVAIIESSQAYKTATDGQSKQAKEDYVSKKITDHYEDLKANPTYDPEHNPYYEVTPSTVALQFKQLAGSKIGKILQPFIESNDAPDTDAVVTALAKGAKDIPEAAKLISQYYQLNNKVKASVTDYAAFGMKPSKSYMWRDPDTGWGIFKSRHAFTDLMNETAVETMLSRRQLEEKIGKESLQQRGNTVTP